MDDAVKPILLLLIFGLLAAGTVLADGDKGIKGEHVFIVHEYRYEPGTTAGDPDTGQALCGTRCNALSVDYRNFIDPGGWRFIKIASDREVTLDLGNPFFGGQCVCTADEYIVRLNDFNKPNLKNATDLLKRE